MPSSSTNTPSHSDSQNDQVEEPQARPNISSYTSQIRDWSDDDIPQTTTVDKGKNIISSDHEDEEYHSESDEEDAPSSNKNIESFGSIDSFMPRTASPPPSPIPYMHPQSFLKN